MKYITPNWPAPSHIHAFTTTKQFNSEKQDLNNELKNQFQLPTQPIWLKQIHSDIAIKASSESIGFEADASFTVESNQVCVVQTADCLPILITNLKGSCAAAIHAGWRGLAAGIIEKTLQGLEQKPEDLLIWLGPAIGPSKFEVGKDVYDVFIQKHSSAVKAFRAVGENKWLADLYALAKLRLQLQNIQHIYGGNFCTYSQEDLFFSYRRDRSQTGRMTSLVWIHGQ